MTKERSTRIPTALAAAALCVALSGCGGSGHEGHAQGDSAAPAVDPATRVHVSTDSDARAIEIAQAVVERMGGWQAWDRTRWLTWKFFGGRRHWWDRRTGDIRIEGSFGRGDEAREMLFLMNVNSKTGRVWESGEEVTDAARLAELLQRGYEVWINDSYWVVMPFKLLDPGVTLKYAGERTLDGGRAADVLQLTFDGVGVTPQNKYEVFVARDNGLVEQWSFFASAEDEQPRFTLPWTDWRRFGEVLIATRHQNPSEQEPEPADWEIDVLGEVPDGLFDEPTPAGVAGP